MVGEEENFIFTAFQVVVPSFESLNNSQFFLVVSFLPNFRKNYLFRIKSHRVPLTYITEFKKKNFYLTQKNIDLISID